MAELVVILMVYVWYDFVGGLFRVGGNLAC